MQDETDTEEDLRLLLVPGSSLGGARPKASVRDRDGHLSIAKFPNKGDEYNAVLWEALALTLAAQAGLNAPTWRLETAAKKPVPLLSAMSMLGAKDNEPLYRKRAMLNGSRLMNQNSSMKWSSKIC